MKRQVFSMFVMIAWTTSVIGQITKEQANSVVLQHLQKEAIEHEYLYVNVSTPSAEGIDIVTSNQEVLKAKYACWAYYLHESDLSQSRYLFVKADNSNLMEVIAGNDLGQSDLTQWERVEGSTDPEVGLVEREGNSIRPLIYPNPVDDWLTLPVAGERFEIHDAKGVRLYSGLLTEDANQIDVSFLNAGVYMLSVYGETKVVLVYKIIKK